MLGRVRPEPPRRLVELTLAAGSVPALSVQPGDGDVDESLQEVALVRGRGPPLVLEFLVRIEVAPGADELQPSLETHGRGLSASVEGASVARVATILLVGVDLFFRGKLEGLLRVHR